MLEGLHPISPTHRMWIETDQQTAQRISDIISETFDPAETAVASFETPDETAWLVEVFFAAAPDEANVRQLVSVVAGDAVAASLTFDAIAAKDWVAASLDGLKPVVAGRFVIHGSHDRAHLTANQIGIEIEAALAFGTGHHGTTLGCLLAINDRLKRGRPVRVLDVGTGTGVLAIAAARGARVQVLASDIDPVSVTTARNNARFNKTGDEVRIIHAAGLKDARFRRNAPFDLILANILPKPLIGMATELIALAAPVELWFSPAFSSPSPAPLRRNTGAWIAAGVPSSH